MLANSELPSHMEEVEIKCDEFFCGEFVQKFHSFNTSIKHSIIDQAGRLIFLFNSYCLRTGYANFIVDLLSDEDMQIRYDAVKILDERVFIDNNQTALQFVDKCNHRLFHAVYDPDIHFSVAIVNLLAKISSLLPGALPRQDLNQVFQFASIATDERSQAAAIFLHNDLLFQCQSPSGQQFKAKFSNGGRQIYADLSHHELIYKIVDVDGTERPDDDSNLDYLMNLWNFVSNFCASCNVPTLVKNLAPICPSLRDWNGFVYLLLMSRDGFLHGNPTTSFILVLQSSIDFVNESKNLQSTSLGDEDEFSPSPFQWLDEWSRMSLTVLYAMPRLIRHFVAEQSAMMMTTPRCNSNAFQQNVSSNDIFLLTQLLPGLDLSSLHAKSLHFNDLICCLREVIDQTGNQPLLEGVARTFKLFEKTSFPGSVRYKEFFEELTGCYRREVSESIAILSRRLAKPQPVSSSSRQFEIIALCFTISSRLNKLANLSSHFNLTCLKLEEKCLVVLEMATERKIPYLQLIEVSIRYVVNSLSWFVSLDKLPNNKENNCNPDRTSSLVVSLLKFLHEILRQPELSYLTSIVHHYLQFLRDNYANQIAAFEKKFHSEERQQVGPGTVFIY